jgi:putative ABC transport system permease protein
MEIRPILSAMRRNKVGAVLIMLQMAVTLAILCNGLFIIQERLAMSHRPSGVDEANVLVIENQWVGGPTDLAARMQADLSTLRSLPGVADAYTTNSYPLSEGGSGEGCNLHPDQAASSAHCVLYFGDEHALATLGLKLIAGRNFNANEIKEHEESSLTPPTAMIITRQLAEKLFPGRSAVGETIYVEYQKTQTPVVGVVDQLSIPWTGHNSFNEGFKDKSIIEPFRYLATDSYYVVRAKPGQLSAVRQSAVKALFDANRARVIEKVVSMAEVREEAFRNDKGLAIILGVVCTTLLAVTAFGIVGLTSYWVTQRRRQIGIRRALGATRSAIVRYFQTENLLIAATGAALGVALAVTINLWMMSSFEMERLDVAYLIGGALVVLGLGQGAVLWPALRAAAIPPAMATRNA